MRIPAAVAALLVLSGALPAAAQSLDYRSRTWSSHGGHDFNGQADRPGDYRCDAYWDRGREDCGAAWRAQRPFVRQYDNRGHHDGGQSYGYGHDAGRHAYPYASEGVRYYGAYGRPDQVYPGSGYGGQTVGHYGVTGYRDTGRTAWCASRYRSYDPASGYYRAYSGRLVFCG